MIEIKHRLSGFVLRTVDAADLSAANLSGADLSGARTDNAAALLAALRVVVL